MYYDECSNMQTNFQAGVNSVYNAVVAKGVTPASTSLSDVITGIGNIPTSTTHTETYSITSNGTKDMGVTHSYRYCSVSVPNYNDGNISMTQRATWIDLGVNNAYRYIHTHEVPNTNSGTYTFPSRETPSTSTDLGETNTIRYINAVPVFDWGWENGAWANRRTMTSYAWKFFTTSDTNCDITSGNAVSGHRYVIFTSCAPSVANAGWAASCEAINCTVQTQFVNQMGTQGGWYGSIYSAEVVATSNTIGARHKYATGFTKFGMIVLIEIGG